MDPGLSAFVRSLSPLSAVGRQTIVAMTPRLVLGTNDLVKDTRADLSANRRPALYWLSAAVVGTGATIACSFGLLLYGLSLMR